MAKASYTNLKIKTNTDKKILIFNDVEIEVLQYISATTKDDLISIVLQKSSENNVYNALKMDMYLHLFIVYVYTNINFTEKQKENEEKLYDALLSSGLLNKIIEQIPEKEYHTLLTMLYKQEEKNTRFQLSFSGVLDSFIHQLPVGAEAAMDMVNSFNPSKFQEVIDFAQKLNGNRPI